jgi:cell division control protein 6
MPADAFSDEYEPRTIVGREKEQEAIVDYLKNCSHGRTDKILYIHGISGIGKTTVARAVMKQFEENSDNAVVVYHNCRNSSYYKCLKEVHQKFFNYNEDKRLTSEEIVQAFTGNICKKAVLVCFLDNFDKLRDLEDFLVDFKKIRKSIARSGLILISTSGNSLTKLIGNRLYSELKFDVLDFRPYTLDEIVEIMQTRTEEAFGKDVIEELAFFEIASFVRNKSQNVRHAFQIIESAMEIAQENSLNKATTEIARKAMKKWFKFYS